MLDCNKSTSRSIMGGDIRIFPLTLDGTTYVVWKVRIEAYAMGKKHEV